MDRIEQRADYARQIRAASLLDAVFLLFYYNKWTRHWGPPSDRPPALDVSEVLPAMSQAAYENALTLVERMWNDATAVGWAYFKYPQAKQTFEDELVAFKVKNPGFSDGSYDLAMNAALFSLR